MNIERREEHIFLKYRTIIMGVAAMCVLCHHEWRLLFADIPYLGATELYFKEISFFGVDVFFFLSGIGLTFSLKKHDLYSYYFNRVKRIVLPVWAVGIYRFYFNEWTAELFWKNITGYNFYFRSIYCFLWFVPAIVTVYILFPFYYKIFEKSKNKRTFTIAGIVLWLILSLLLDNVIRGDLFGFTNRIPIILTGIYTGWHLQNHRGDALSKLDWVTTCLILVLGLILCYRTNFKDMYLLVPVSNCCIPNFLLAISLPMIIAQIADFFSRYIITNFINKIFSLFGMLSLEIYVVQELFGDILHQSDPYMASFTFNVKVFLGTMFWASVLWGLNVLAWRLIDVIGKNFRKNENK